MCIPGGILASSAQKQPEGSLAVKQRGGTSGECVECLEETVLDKEGAGVINKVCVGQRET